MIEHTMILEANDERIRTDTASILERADGTLLVAYHSYSSSNEGSGDFGKARIYISESADQGRTWRNERMLADIDPGDLNVMSPYLCAVDDEILLGYVRNHSKGDTSMILCRSSDGGASFGEPSHIWRHQNEYRLQGGSTSLVRLSDGRLVLPFQSVEEVWVENENEYVGSYVSDDGGRTWTESRNHVRLPLRGAMEPSIAELPDGRIAMSMRTQLGSVFMSWSHDRGESWTPAQAYGPRGPEMSTCLRLVPGSEDHLVLFWNDADYDPTHHHYGIRTPLSAALSKDGGLSWTKLGDIDGGDCMLTNLGCTFLSSGTAVVTYLAGADSEVSGGKWMGKRPGRDQTSYSLKAALIDRAWFEI